MQHLLIHLYTCYINAQNQLAKLKTMLSVIVRISLNQTCTIIDTRALIIYIRYISKYSQRKQ